MNGPSLTRLHSVEVNPLTKSEISWSKSHRKVPIAVFEDGRVVPESEAIVSALLEMRPPAATFASDEARKWSAWATSELAITIYPNMTRSFSECREALAYADDKFGPLQAFLIRTVGAFGMSMAHGKIIKKYNITDERQALRDKVAAWEGALGKNDFRGGAAPDLGDVAVFGILDALKGLGAHRDILAQSPRLADWSSAMEEALPKPAIVE